MTAQRLRRQIDSIIGLIIPQETENAAQAAAQSAGDVLWSQEQEYSRRYGLHSSMIKVDWVSGFRDHRKFHRKHYKLTNRT